MCRITFVLKKTDVSADPRILTRMVGVSEAQAQKSCGQIFLNLNENGTPIRPWPTGGWSLGLAQNLCAAQSKNVGLTPPFLVQSRWVVAFDGEIHNQKELRNELESQGYSFKTQSVVELVAASYEVWGASCLNRFRGIWALIILDVVRQEVFCACDRLGLKSLYLWEDQNFLCLCSEIKQLFVHPGFHAKLSKSQALHYLSFGYVNQNASFYEGVQAVEKGTYLQFSLKKPAQKEVSSYWSFNRIEPSERSVLQASQSFFEKLANAMAPHRDESGFALGGGLNSAALLFASARNKLLTPQTFSLAPDPDPVGEREKIEALLLKTRAQSYFYTPQAKICKSELSSFIKCHEEPLPSLALYGGFCVARLAQKQGIEKLIFGYGADESLGAHGKSFLNPLLSGKWLPLGGPFASPYFSSDDPSEIHPIPPALWSLLGFERRRFFGKKKGLLNEEQIPLKTRGADAFFPFTYLNLILRAESRNAQAFLIEPRFPFLDHELIELCLSFHTSILRSRGFSKEPLRQAFAKDLPKAILHSKKSPPYSIPVHRWLMGELRGHMIQWLEEDRPIFSVIDRSNLHKLLQWHRKYPFQENIGHLLMRMYLFDQWLEHFSVSLKM